MKRTSKAKLEETLEEYLKYRMSDNNNTTRTRFISIEGMDGVGKEYTSLKLQKYLTDLGFFVKLISFPVYNSCTGKEVKKVLSGKFGDPFQIDPVLAAFPFILDRYNAIETNEEHIDDFDICTESGDDIYVGRGLDFVIFDRYVTSNVIYTLARSNKDLTSQQVSKVIKSLFSIEYDLLDFPKPDLEVVLTAQPNISDYLRYTRDSKDTKKDVNETNLEYMDNVNKIIDKGIVYKNKEFKKYRINNILIDVVKPKFKDISSTLLELEKPSHSKILKSSNIVIHEIIDNLVSIIEKEK